MVEAARHLSSFGKYSNEFAVGFPLWKKQEKR
jgi:hypothetical protein